MIDNATRPVPDLFNEELEEELNRLIAIAPEFCTSDEERKIDARMREIKREIRNRRKLPDDADDALAETLREKRRVEALIERRYGTEIPSNIRNYWLNFTAQYLGEE